MKEPDTVMDRFNRRAVKTVTVLISVVHQKRQEVREC